MLVIYRCIWCAKLWTVICCDL